MHLIAIMLKLLLLLALGSLVIELWHSSSSLEQFFDSSLVLLSLFLSVIVIALALLLVWLNRRNSLYDSPETSPILISAHEVRQGRSNTKS
jgi:hypothetical protein